MIKKHLNKNYSKKLIKNNRLDFDSSYFNKLDQLTIDKIAKSLAKNIIFWELKNLFLIIFSI